MAAAVARSHDWFRNPLPYDDFRTPARPKPCRNGTSPKRPKSQNKTSPRTTGLPLSSSSPKSSRKGRRRSPAGEKEDVVVKFPGKDLVMGEVKILKRGEKKIVMPEESESSGEESVFCSTDPIGPEPEILPVQVKIVEPKVGFAGSGYMCSPNPRALPMPTSSLLRKDLEKANLMATKGLRCLLRLDLS